MDKENRNCINHTSVNTTQQVNHFLISWNLNSQVHQQKPSQIIDVPGWKQANTKIRKYHMLKQIIYNAANVNPKLFKLTLHFYHTVWKENVILTHTSIDNLKPNNPKQKIYLSVSPRNKTRKILPGLPQIPASPQRRNKFIPPVVISKQPLQHQNTFIPPLPSIKIATVKMEPVKMPLTPPKIRQQMQEAPKWRVGDTMNKNSIKIKKLLGIGSFGTVLLCTKFDSTNDTHGRDIAVKVLPHGNHHDIAGIAEAAIFSHMKKYDQYFQSNIVLFWDTFRWSKANQTHVCLVFEPLGQSLYGFLKMNNFRGFMLHQINQMAKDLFSALDFCHVIANVTHGDIKPENLLLVCPKFVFIDEYYQYVQKLASNNNSKEMPTILPKQEYEWIIQHHGKGYFVPMNAQIKLIDFGSAIIQQKNSNYSHKISTRQYKSPEVIIGSTWHHPTDIWSAGCVLAELYTGHLLFNTHDNIEHLALIEKITQQSIPTNVISNVHSSFNRNLSPWIQQQQDNDEPLRKRRKITTFGWFQKGCTLNWPQSARSKSSQQFVKNQKTLNEIIECGLLANLITQCLQWIPANRITAANAVKHALL